MKCSSSNVGASTIGTNVCVTKTTGATWIAGRDCSELISLSVPTPEAAAVEAAHNSATST